MLSFDDYVRHDALGLATLIRDGEVTPAEVVDAALARADAVDPAINAFVARRDDVVRGQASESLRDGVFAGVPFVFKDLFCWQEGWPAQAGSNLWKGFVAPVDFTRTFERIAHHHVTGRNDNDYTKDQDQMFPPVAGHL